jgi:hypothetical protein
MSTQYRLVQSGKTASGGCSAGPRFVRACSATDYYYYYKKTYRTVITSTPIKLLVIFRKSFGVHCENEMELIYERRAVLEFNASGTYSYQCPVNG